MKGEEAMEIFKIVKAKGMLPKKMEDLVPLSFIGQTAVTFYRSMIKGFDQLKMTEEQRKRTLKDGQEAGEMLLDIETRIGELLPSAREERGGVPRDTQRGDGGKFKAKIPEGLSHRRLQGSRAISKHPEIVEKVKAQARENEDIPTRTAVINQIRYESEKKTNEAAKANVEKMKGIIAIEQVEYINALDQAIRVIPQKPPKQWNDDAFKEAKSKAQIIIKRLEVFNGRKE